jgi:two-component system cell cycle sensor histidine kinase/response regulator CckA
MGISEWPTRSDRITARTFAIIYIVWSALWVLGSDYVLQLVINGPRIEWETQSYKGLVYVLVSGLILFLAVRERDRKHRAERARNESMLRSLRQSGLLGIYEWRADGHITDANHTFLETLGYTREELASGKLTLKALTPPEYWEVDRIANEQVLENGCCTLYEKEALRKDGTRLHVLVGRALLEGCKDCGVGYAVDVSEKKQMESEHAQLQQQLLQSEKLNALGQLAGGIAHDFNNLLSIIVGYASLTESRLGPNDSQLRENTTHVLRAAEKAKNLTRKLLAFGRKQLLNPERLSLNELISELYEMLSHVLEERVKLELRLGAEVGNIEADRSQIEQVMLNLVVNARDAMPNGGTLTIQTFSSTLPGNAHSELKGEYATVRVSDTGIGMNEAIRLRIFEPFFTTKQERGGTGLGLATVYGIVKQSGGHIEVDSKPGDGSAFTVYFPRVQALRAATRKVEQAVTSTAGSETILLIEDLDELRGMIATVLTSHGYNVLEARDGAEAVNLAASHFGPIQLILSDVIMPNLNGPEAVRQIRARRSDTKAIYMTGYSDQALATDLATDSVTLEKPIQPDALLARIREVLDQTQSGTRGGD